MLMNLQQIRQDTPAVSNLIHLNNAGAALSPQIVVDTITDFIKEEALMGGYEIMSAVQDQVALFYKGVAQLLHCHEHNIAFTYHATDSYNRALSSIAFAKGEVILTTDDDYVSNQLAFLQLQKRYGVKIIRVANEASGDLSLDSMQKLIHQHHPKLVAVTHVPTNSGLVQPIAAVGKMCRKKGIWYLVDACQSVGQMEVNVEEIGCDFLTATYRKWLRGPRGTGFLYVSDRALAANLEPHFIDLRGSFWKSPNEYELMKTAKRYELWERSYALMLGAKVATEYALQIGIGNIQERVQFLAQYTRQALMTVPHLRLLDQGTQQCGIITAHLPHWQPDDLLKAMVEQKINISVARNNNAVIDFAKKKVTWALRISPHYYNTIEEIDETIAFLQKQ